MFNLEGKNAFVSGASRGLGRQFANALAKAGANIVITSRTLESLETTKQEIEALGRKCIEIEMEVLKEDSIVNAVKRAEAELGPISILVNNAGCNIRKPALEVTWKDWETVVDTNLKGAFFLAKEIAKGMTERGYGRIVNIGSVTSVAGYAGLGPYGASRGGIKQLTMSLAHDWGDKGVTVNCLAQDGLKLNKTLNYSKILIGFPTSKKGSH